MFCRTLAWQNIPKNQMKWTNIDIFVAFLKSTNRPFAALPPEISGTFQTLDMPEGQQ